MQKSLRKEIEENQKKTDTNIKLMQRNWRTDVTRAGARRIAMS